MSDSIYDDAMRYRWLRDKADTYMPIGPLVHMTDGMGCSDRIIVGEELDIEVDKARAASE